MTTSCLLLIALFMGGFALLSYENSLRAKSGITDRSIFGLMMKDLRFITEPFNVLLLIGDKEEYNTDTMMLINVHPSDYKTTILSIPRDTKVHVDGSRVPKINSAYAAGGHKPGLVVNTVKNLMHVNVNYYIYINIPTVKQVVKLLGGVDFDVPTDLDYDDPAQDLHIHLQKGLQHLDEDKAEQLLRYRKSNSGKVNGYYDGSDLKRMNIQVMFLKELLRQKANMYYLPKMGDIISIVFGNMKTNFTINEIMGLATGINKLDPDKIETFMLPGSDSNEPGGWYYVMNPQKTSEIVNAYFQVNGGFMGNASE